MFTKRNLIRLIVTIIFALLAYGVTPDSWRHLRVVLPGLSPLLNIGGAVAALSFGAFTLLALPLLALPFLAGRFFCWRLCPMGFLAETVGRLNRWNKGAVRKVPFIGKALVLLVIGSAAAGYPVLIWTDPLCVFNGFFAAWREPLTWISAATATGFVLILLLSLLAPNVWCHRLCPLGGLQEMLTNLGKRLRAPAREDDAVRPIENVRIARRTLLGLAVGGFSGIAYRGLSNLYPVKPAPIKPEHGSGGGRGRGQQQGRGLGGRMRQQRGAAEATLPYIRPPGAASEAFNALCARCGNCMAACPYGLLLPDLGSSGIDGLFTPVMLFRSRNALQEGFCFQECTACTEVCPTGALRPLAREEKQQTAIGLAHVSKRKCLAWEKGEYCMVCQEFCPYHAIEEVEREGVMCPVVDAAKCRGCGACESQCPALPIAITVAGRSPQLTLEHSSPYLDA